VNDRYLWDRSGDPDPQVQQLEQTLGALRHRGDPLDYTRLPAAAPARRPRRRWRWRLVLALSAPAMLVLAAGVWWRVSVRMPPSAQEAVAAAAPWVVLPLDGPPGAASSPAEGEATLPAGQSFETGAASRARMSALGVGVLDVGPSTRLRVLTVRAGEYRLALERGSLHAHIWAAPGVFAVDTPSATALDLGCSYTLEVDDRGRGRLRVTLGWVGLGRDRVASLVPRDAVCALTPAGPSIPHFEDAPAALVDALAAIGAASDAVLPPLQLERALRAARPRDAFTLWHLLRRTRGEAAERVHSRLAALAPPPAGVTREQALAGDQDALDAWWETLGLGNAALFRKWGARTGL
jgi:hypothetical protein